MKIKNYSKLTKKNVKVNFFVLFNPPLPKPKIPFRLFKKVHKVNFYEPSEIILIESDISSIDLIGDISI